VTRNVPICDISDVNKSKILIKFHAIKNSKPFIFETVDQLINC